MADIDWEAVAKREGWKEVEADPNPMSGHPATGPCLHHEGQDRIWPLGDWKGAAVDLGIDPETGLYGDEDDFSVAQPRPGI